MIGTEQEAREWWCPMARAITCTDEYWSGPSNRDFAIMNGQNACNCLASKCAMWRWAEYSDQTGPGYKFTGTRGYCGIGGKP